MYLHFLTLHNGMTYQILQRFWFATGDRAPPTTMDHFGCRRRNGLSSCR